MQLQKRYLAASAATLLALTGSAHAAIDLTAISAAIADSQTAAVTVAAAVLVLIVTVKAYKYIKRAL